MSNPERDGMTPDEKWEELCRQRRKDVMAWHSAMRQEKLVQGTPPWADRKAIRAIYREAQRRTAETGVEHHVDHIIPLQGRLVSGLHVQNNLQILTGTENRRKRNHF